MHTSKILFLINESARAVRGIYEEGHKPTLFKTLDDTIQVDDFAVVQSGTRHGMTVVKITEVDVDIDFDASEEVQWLVQKIDRQAFDKVLRQEKQAISAVQVAEHRRKREELPEVRGQTRHTTQGWCFPLS